MRLKDVKVGLFITGGIAAYKMANFARLLIKEGAQVRVAMTPGAQAFITPLTLQTLTKHSVLVDTFAEEDPEVVQHIHLADWCDIALVAPATANTIAKLAQGLADNVVTSVLLAVTCPIVAAPAMNVNMYQHPATQRNLEQLRQDGVSIIEPATGFLAEGYEGKGRLPEESVLLDHLVQVYWSNNYPQILAGKKVAISAGGTIERIDPVRYISNDSSGKMGYALAQAAKLLGADVTLVSTKPELPLPLGVKPIYVTSAQEMFTQMVALQEASDILIMAAAVSDYRVVNASNHKIKKQDQDSLAIQLAENPDILAHLGQHKRPDQLVVGFAAESQHLIDYARVKLAKKKADWIVANDISDPSIGFNSAENRATLLGKDGQVIELEQQDKLSFALALFKHLGGEVR
ncbi:bifunctional phosphopantothenoylcysteine decarboxylase/phosphopantothenate--cysteine ligase CoaBC [Hutsoniella sourekii]|uniref:bifunctional phosphopantothenoylcysteine decarboxylase/phosphopantothenate--cysteine ligase CoaBC n=1 Tax=Hutsoniella sourekii TaxID=87650 RepID=UPI000481DE93|nr:bifunctional phosphopantothenoylcysteine decarboxylase/phosphopantothenate--cysteine ligase CoaBC [Hutsoniella sourekii]